MQVSCTTDERWKLQVRRNQKYENFGRFYGPPPLNIKISKNRFAGLKMVPLGTFFQKISFLAFNDSERPQWTEKIWLKVWNFGGFLGKKGPKNGNFEKSLVRPQDGPRSIQNGRLRWNGARRWQRMAQEAFQISRRWPNMAARRPQDCPRWPKRGAREAQDGPKMGLRLPKVAPRWAQDGPRWPQTGSKSTTWGQDGRDKAQTVEKDNCAKT